MLNVESARVKRTCGASKRTTDCPTIESGHCSCELEKSVYVFPFRWSEVAWCLHALLLSCYENTHDISAKRIRKRWCYLVWDRYTRATICFGCFVFISRSIKFIVCSNCRMIGSDLMIRCGWFLCLPWSNVAHTRVLVHHGMSVIYVVTAVWMRYTAECVCVCASDEFVCFRNVTFAYLEGETFFSGIEQFWGGSEQQPNVTRLSSSDWAARRLLNRRQSFNSPTRIYLWDFSVFNNAFVRKVMESTRFGNKF